MAFCISHKQFTEWEALSLTVGQTWVFKANFEPRITPYMIPYIISQ